MSSLIFRNFLMLYIVLVTLFASCGADSFNRNAPQMTQDPVIAGDSLNQAEEKPQVSRFDLGFYVDSRTSVAKKLEKTQVVLYEDGKIIMLSKKDSLETAYNTLKKLPAEPSHSVKEGIHTISYYATYETPSVFNFIEEIPAIKISYQLTSDWRLIRIKINERVYYSTEVTESDVKAFGIVKAFHTVKKGDTVSALCHKYNLRKEELEALNEDNPVSRVAAGIRNNILYPGTKLRVQ